MNMEGYLPNRPIKAVVFVILSLCLFASMVAGILLTWEAITQVTASRIFWTLFIVSGDSVVFTLLNLVFGQVEATLFGARQEGPPIDPAFADRLHKAKEMRSGEQQSKAG